MADAAQDDMGASDEPASMKTDLPSLAIRRPVLVLVLNLLIIVAGMAAIMGVEVRELPNVDRPIVTVRGIFPGASPETMDAEVTSIVEGAVARVTGVRSISAASEENNFRIRVEFSPTRDLDTAAADLREAVSRVQRELPNAVEQLTVIKADADSEPIMRLVVESDVLNETDLTRVIENDLVPELIGVDGVADVTLFGDRRRMLRVVLDPLRLTSFGLSIADVAEVLDNAPFDVPAGSFRSVDQELLVRADASVVQAEQIEQLIIRDPVRLKDVANVFFGPEDATSWVRHNGRQVIGLGVIRQAQSNTIDISDGITAKLESLNQRYDNLRVTAIADDAVFIRGSIAEILITLMITVGIVVLTIWLFIGALRTTIIPLVAIPVSLVGTVAAIWLLGFSINLITLLALVLSTGMIVDDSIVVLENIQRRKGQGLGRRAAAVLGTRQVFFAVIATTATLISVFIPISFLPSTAGLLFREFGFVLAIAVIISSFVSLSLVPAMASRLPLDQTQGRPSSLAMLGQRVAAIYASSLRHVVGTPLLMAGVALLFIVISLFTYQRLNQELLPSEDRGFLYIYATGPDGAGLSYSDRQADKIEALLQPYVDSGEIAGVMTIVGRWDLNRVFVLAPLAPWESRQRSQQEIAAELRGHLSSIPGVRAGISSPNSLNLRGARGGLEVALLGNNYTDLYEVARRMALALDTGYPGLDNPDISYQPTQPQLALEIDRRRATDLGIPLEDLALTLRAMIDGDDLTDLSIDDEAVPIFLESRTGAIDDPGDLANLFVRSDDGMMIPLSSVATLVENSVAAELDRQSQRRAIEIDIDRAEDYPLGEAVQTLEKLAAEMVPPGMEMVLQGEAETLDETSRDLAITYAIALLVVFLVLAAQFESFASALVVMTTVPFGIGAAVLALYLTGTSLNIYSQIGLVLLIGIMAKNGILIVEFADQLRDRGMAVKDAAIEAATIRLRPIAMTMMSTVLGGLPLILSDGAGAEARNAIGWVVFGGLGIAAVFTLYLTPLTYIGFARFVSPRSAEGQKLATEMTDAEKIPDHVGQAQGGSA